MAERQLHGFNFESRIIRQFNLTKSESYTDKWDAYTDTGIPVSIKVEKHGTDIELADLYRNMNVTENFYLVVGFWNGTKDNITDMVSLFIPVATWNTFFNDDIALECKELLQNTSNRHEDDDVWKVAIKQLSKKWKDNTPNLIRPRFKRDHKTQKRIQCAINYRDFRKYFVPTFGAEL